MMKKVSFYLLAGLLCCGLFSACEDDDKGGPDVEEKEISPIDFFLLSRGNWGQNNASLGFYDSESKKYEADIFAEQNGEGLGESAERMLIHGSKIYITVYGSNAIIITDLNGKKIEVVKPEGSEPMGPRGLAAHEDKVYISYQLGHCVAVLDTTSLNIERTIEVGRYPEQIAVSKDKLYVANSGGGDYPNYDKTVSVINLSSFEKEVDIEVVINPCKILTNSQGDLFVISMGNYESKNPEIFVPNTLQKIDRDTYKVEIIGNASSMDIFNDALYTVYSQSSTDGSTAKVKFIKYDSLTGKVQNDSFINESSIQNPYCINVNPSNGNIYINDFDWVTTNDLYVFDKNGNKITVLETEGYDTAGVWFRP